MGLREGPARASSAAPPSPVPRHRGLGRDVKGSVGATPGRRPRGCREATTAMLDRANTISCESKGPAGAGLQDAARAQGRTRCGRGKAGPSRPLPLPRVTVQGSGSRACPAAVGGLHAGHPRLHQRPRLFSCCPLGRWGIPTQTARPPTGERGSLSPFPSTPEGGGGLVQQAAEAHQPRPSPVKP